MDCSMERGVKSGPSYAPRPAHVDAKDRQMNLHTSDVLASEVALGVDAASIRHDFIEKLFFALAKFADVATRNDHFLALAYTVRDRLLHRWVRSARTYLEGRHRT